MGAQIAIVQSRDDERALLLHLKRRYQLLALPRMFDQREITPVELGELDATAQVLFRLQDAALFQQSIREIDGRAGQYQVDRSRLLGRFLEWNRTDWVGEHEAQAGRFYFNRPSGRDDEASQALESVYRAIRSWIQKNSPLRSEGRHPMFIGAHLARMIQEKRARVVYPNGDKVVLVPNV